MYQQNRGAVLTAFAPFGLINYRGCVAFKQHNARFGHAEYLVDMVQGLMEEADASFSDLTHIAAGCGPGSFTGLRVCLSAAKGYMLASTI